MKIFTSNFWLSGRHPGAVAIANSTRGYPGLKRYKPLTPPPWALVRASRVGAIVPAHFDRVYRGQLRALDPRQVLADLEAMVPGQDVIVLLCWESPGAYCHRKLAAEWLETELGISVPELL